MKLTRILNHSYHKLLLFLSISNTLHIQIQQCLLFLQLITLYFVLCCFTVCLWIEFLRSFFVKSKNQWLSCQKCDIRDARESNQVMNSRLLTAQLRDMVIRMFIADKITDKWIQSFAHNQVAWEKEWEKERRDNTPGTRKKT